MIPPEAIDPCSDARDTAPPAVSVLPVAPVRLIVLAKRADFLRAASSRRQSLPGFLLQARARLDASADVRIGYTCSKKIGNAVARNRAKRRLREVARAVLPGLARSGWDYVLVGRPGATIARDFAALLDDLQTGLARIHTENPPRKPAAGAARP